jgi:hypothetical protein
MKNEENPQAFPIVKLSDDSFTVEAGMTLRDYFAAKAMQSLITIKEEVHNDYLADQAYKMADSMLIVRSKP